jgi:hypothetical protein
MSNRRSAEWAKQSEPAKIHGQTKLLEAAGTAQARLCPPYEDRLSATVAYA